MRKSNFDSVPFVAVNDAIQPCVTGWGEIAIELQRAIGRGRLEKPILVVDCYPGVDELAVLKELASRLEPKLVIHAAEACHSSDKIDRLVAPFVGNVKALSVRFSGLSLVNFFNAEPLWRFRRTIDELKEGLVLIVGCGASLIAWGHILVYADLARRTAQERFRRNEIGNLGADNKSIAADLKRQRAFFVDWRVGDRWKRPLIKRWDYVLDTNIPAEPKLADATDIRSGMREAAARPFRLVPVLDPDRNGENVASGFDCVPEESSLLLGFGETRFEIPAIDLLFYQPGELLGEAVHLRLNGEFPIPSSFLNTAGGESNSIHRVGSSINGRAERGMNGTEQKRVNGVEPVASGEGWWEEKSALHESDLVETRRYWFTKKLLLDTNDGVNVLNLVEGEEAVVESPTNAFAPFVVHYAETFIVPAAVGAYTIRPHGQSAGQECAAIKAFVRTNALARGERKPM